MNYDASCNECNDGLLNSLNLEKGYIVDHAPPGVRNQLFNEMNTKHNDEIVRIIMGICEYDKKYHEKFTQLFSCMVNNIIGRDLLVNISWVMSHRRSILNQLVSYLFECINAPDANKRCAELSYVLYLCGSKMSDQENACRAQYLKSMYNFVTLFVRNKFSEEIDDTCLNCVVSFLTFLSSGFFDNFKNLSAIIALNHSCSTDKKVNLDVNAVSDLHNIFSLCTKFYKMRLKNSSGFCYFSMNDNGCFYNIDVDIDNFDASKMSEICSVSRIENNKVYFSKYNLSLLSGCTHEVCHWLQYLEYNVMGKSNNYAISIYNKNISAMIENIDLDEYADSNIQNYSDEQHSYVALSAMCHTDNLETGVIYGGTVDQDNRLVFDYINSKNFDVYQSLMVSKQIEYLRYGHNMGDDGNFYDSKKNIYDILLNYSDKMYEHNITEFMSNLVVAQDISEKDVALDKNASQNNGHRSIKKKKKKKKTLISPSQYEINHVVDNERDS